MVRACNPVTPQPWGHHAGTVATSLEAEEGATIGEDATVEEISWRVRGRGRVGTRGSGSATSHNPCQE